MALFLTAAPRGDQIAGQAYIGELCTSQAASAVVRDWAQVSKIHKLDINFNQYDNDFLRNQLLLSYSQNNV